MWCLEAVIVQQVHSNHTRLDVIVIDLQSTSTLMWNGASWCNGDTKDFLGLHRVDMINVSHFVTWSHVSLSDLGDQREDLGDRREDFGDQREDLGEQREDLGDRRKV